MKLFLIPLLLSFFLFIYPQPNKETARKDVERCKKKLSIYREAIGVLNQDLIKLQQQWEATEDKITITLVDDLQRFRSKKEKETYIYQVVSVKEKVERNIEKTILTINDLTDSIATTRQKIQEAYAVINEKQPSNNSWKNPQPK